MAERIYLLCKESGQKIGTKALDIDIDSKSIIIQDRPVIDPNDYFDFEDGKTHETPWHSVFTLYVRIDDDYMRFGALSKDTGRPAWENIIDRHLGTLHLSGIGSGFSGDAVYVLLCERRSADDAIVTHDNAPKKF